MLTIAITEKSTQLNMDKMNIINVLVAFIIVAFIIAVVESL